MKVLGFAGASPVGCLLAGVCTHAQVRAYGLRSSSCQSPVCMWAYGCYVFCVAVGEKSNIGLRRLAVVFSVAEETSLRFCVCANDCLDCDAVLYHYSNFHPPLQVSQLAAALLVVLLGSKPVSTQDTCFFHV